ncbi:universal stress protein [Pseudarthrobacter sp. DSP2-3-2b1]|uniref:universal stress protein n=1 Tax=Pseudarthrobacter sp. DSP2-3-2b1 TaxID=2804661 RepID=UPI003CF0C4E6
MPSPERIVAGYDGSEPAALAVRWAARHARLLAAELEVVHCSLWPLLTGDLGPVPGIAGSGLRHQAQAVLDQGKTEALTAASEVRVRTSLLYGLPPPHLRRISDGAAMLVLGSRGIGGFMGLLVGSVSLELAATATCPVVVVRFDNKPDGRVVVGIDSAGSEAALGKACAIATATRAELLIIHVIQSPDSRAGSAVPAGLDAAGRILRTAVRQARALAPELTISQELATDTSIPRALLNAARGAALIVVGSRGQGLIKGTFGSNAHAVLHHATGPVMICRQPPGS